MLEKQKYEKLKNDPSPWYCTFCTNEITFSKMSNNELNNLHAAKPTSSTKSTSIKQSLRKPEKWQNAYSTEELKKFNTGKHHFPHVLTI